jgi:(p)ppGpp synthase/HD superfamily hydrolase
MLTKQQIFDHIQESCANRNVNPGINEAMAIASLSLMEEVDKTGKDYAVHWVTVAFDGTDSWVKQQIGILHDVIEDTDWTIQDLEKLGFDKRVISGVQAMTRDEEKNEDYFSFIERCSQDPYGIDVKLKDLKHNQSKSRNNFIPGERDYLRETKYIVSYQYLVAVKQGKIEAGSPVEDFASSFFANDKNYDLLKPVFEKEGRTLQKHNISRKFSGLTPN